MIKWGTIKSYVALTFAIIFLGGFILLPFSGLFSSKFKGLSVVDAMAQGKYPHPLLLEIAFGGMIIGFLGLFIIGRFFNDDEIKRGN
jgi:di/tricarboxylate transporter